MRNLRRHFLSAIYVLLLLVAAVIITSPGRAPGQILSHSNATSIQGKRVKNPLACGDTFVLTWVAANAWFDCIANAGGGGGGGGGNPGLSGSGSLAFPAIPDGACAIRTFTLSGAIAGNDVRSGWPPALEAGLSGIMRASAANTIEVRLCNLSGASVTPAVQTFKATAF